MIYAGIDLGTTFSCISRVSLNRVPTLFPDRAETDRFATPSVVHIGERGYLVGQPVENLIEDEPGLPVARFAKLKMGLASSAYVDHVERHWSPQAISALILRKLKADAEHFENDKIESVVITVPAQFGDTQRRATREAAELAGLKVAKMVEEPVAAATYYGIDEKAKDQTLFVYDLGGGTFDATLMQTSPKGLYVIGSEGAADIGGRRFDDAIMKEVAGQFLAQHRIDPLHDPSMSSRLRRYAEEIKLKLCRPGGRGQVRETVVLSGRPIDFLLTLPQFEKLVAHLVEETIAACGRCLQTCSLDWDDIDQIMLVGGSSLVPLVRKRMEEESKKGADGIVQKRPHQAVAYGASLLAAQLAGQVNADVPELTQQVATADLGLRIFDHTRDAPGVKVLIKRNSPLPVQCKQVFYTGRDDQRRMVLDVVQSRGGTDAGMSLGSFEFGPIVNPRKGYPVEVCFSYNAEGIVTVKATDPSTGREMEHEVDGRGQGAAGVVSAKERELVMNARINEV